MDRCADPKTDVIADVPRQAFDDLFTDIQPVAWPLTSLPLTDAVCATQSARPASQPSSRGLSEGSQQRFDLAPAPAALGHASPEIRTAEAPFELRAPSSEEEAIDWLQLVRSHRIGPISFRRLLARFGTAKAALEGVPDLAGAAGLKRYMPCPRAIAEAEYEAGCAASARLLALSGTDYPPALALLDDAPPLLWAQGDLALLHRPSLSIVGARNASALAQRMTRHLSQSLGAAGMVITSGLARGVDAMAHQAALPTGTIAVMAGGVDQNFPPENAALAAQIRRNGLCLSEQPMGLRPQARHFPRRNRLVSGLSQALLVVEAALKSGSLITARDAADQGREVMAVPGHPFDPRCSGTLALLRDGATLVRGPEDVIAALDWQSAAPPARRGLPSPHTPCHAPAPRGKTREARVASSVGAAQSCRPAPDRVLPTDGLTGTALQNAVLSALSVSPLSEAVLLESLPTAIDAIAQALTELELSGKIHRSDGGLLSRSTRD